jgi:hypothetical protein
MERMAILILVLACAGMGWGLKTETDKAAGLAAQVQTLSARRAEETAKDLQAMRDKCSVQARTVFKDGGYDNSSYFEDHWNQQLGKCFENIHVMSTLTDGYTETDYLLDAYEEREYGEEIVVSSTGTGFDRKPLECLEKAPATDEQHCRSDAEYANFVRGFME